MSRKKFKLQVKGLPEIRMNENQVREAVGQMYGFIAEDVVSEVLANCEVNATSSQKKKIASRLFDEMHDNDDEFLKLEDKNILYAASEMGLCKFDEVWKS